MSSSRADLVLGQNILSYCPGVFKYINLCHTALPGGIEMFKSVTALKLSGYRTGHTDTHTDGHSLL